MLDHITAPAPRMILRLLVLRKILSELRQDLKSPDAIAEIGAGLGDAMSLVRSCMTPKAIDIFEESEKAIKVLKNRFSNYGENCSEVLVKTAFTPAEKAYQLVFCFEVIEHIEDDHAFIQMITNSLDTGGYFVGSVPAYMSKWQDVDVLAGHYRRYEKQELIEKLKACGLSNVVIHTYGFPLINLLYPLRKIYYSSLLKNSKSLSKQEATAKSGVSRGLAMRFNKPLVYAVVRFFSIFQSLPYLSSYGDGFVFTCQKK